MTLNALSIIVLLLERGSCAAITDHHFWNTHHIFVPFIRTWSKEFSNTADQQIQGSEFSVFPCIGSALLNKKYAAQKIPKVGCRDDIKI